MASRASELVHLPPVKRSGFEKLREPRMQITEKNIEMRQPEIITTNKLTFYFAGAHRVSIINENC